MNDESGWLIERRDLPQPVWWCGASSRGMEWSPNSLEAIRFSRKIDADMVNVSMLGSCGDATEHKWIATPELAAVPPSPDLCACGHGRAMHFDEDGDHNGPCLWQVHKDAPFCKCDMWHRKPSLEPDSPRRAALGVGLCEWHDEGVCCHLPRGHEGPHIFGVTDADLATLDPDRLAQAEAEIARGDVVDWEDVDRELGSARAPSPSTDAVEPPTAALERIIKRISYSPCDGDDLLAFEARGELDQLIAACRTRRPAPSQEKLRTWKEVGADRLADEVAVLIARHVIDSRSPAGDALLDYRDDNRMRSPRSDRLAELEAEVERLKASPSTRDGVIEECARVCDQEAIDDDDRASQYGRGSREQDQLYQMAQADRVCARLIRDLKSHPAARAVYVEVYSRPECIFYYCPHPETCKANDRCGSPA